MGNAKLKKMRRTEEKGRLVLGNFTLIYKHLKKPRQRTNRDEV